VLYNLAAIRPTNAISICVLLWLHLESLHIRGIFADSERFEKCGKAENIAGNSSAIILNTIFLLMSSYRIKMPDDQDLGK